jgi:hypothetical protein
MRHDASNAIEASDGRATDDEHSEARYLAEKYKLNIDQARQLIGLYGNNRQRLHAAAKKIIT